MKVKKLPGRKVPPSPPVVSDFVTRTLACSPDVEFAKCLEPCLSKWPFPKSDLFHWTALLDQFDELLLRVVDARWDRETKLQKEPLTETERRLTIAILQFTRLLLENCSSRNIYCSYDRLKRLLVTDHADILEKGLELLLIPARKLDSQSSLRNTFEREVGTDELAIVAQLSLPFIPEMGELEEAKFALRFRNYHAERLARDGDSGIGSQYVKMLATAIFLMAQPEGSVDSAFFAMSPTLVTDTARLITPNPGSGDWRIQLAALSILRSCLKSGARSTEILHALQLGASHGPIASIFRLLVDSMVAGQEELPLSTMFIYGYLDFVAVLATQVDIDDSFVNSGIVFEAVRAIDAADSRYYKVVEKALYILDALIHHYVSAIDFFFANNGLMTIVKQTVRYIELGGSKMADASAGSTGMAHADAIILQCLLRFIDKLLNTNGADDRLRNLLEGPLFRAMVTIFEAGSEGFSPEIMSHAISIIAAFIHNEPTALTVLQEVGAPQALTRAVKRSIPAVAELIGKIPHAFSAVCLNPAGTEYFARIDPVTTLCSLFLQVDYLKLLRSRGTASSLGAAMDEFIRHHPQFRSIVLQDVVGTLRQIPSTISTLRSYPTNADLFASCDLLPVRADEPLSSFLSQSGEKRSEPVLSLMAETVSSFIEGLVQTPTHAKEFIELGGVQALMEVFYSGGISYDFTIYNESLSISHMLRLLSDVDGDHVISAILRSLVKHATSMDTFIGQVGPTSTFESVLREDSMAINEQNALFQSLTGALAVIGLLRDLYVTHSYTYARLGGALLRGFTSKEGEAALVFLSILLKVCSWEFGQLMQTLDQPAAAALLVRAKMDFKSPVFQSFSTAVYQFSEGRSLQGLSDDSLKERAANVPVGQCKNTLYLCFTLQRLLTCISAVFSGLAKLLSSRNIVIDAEGSAKLVGIIANSGINALNWLIQEGQEASLRLRSFLMTHVMQFLPVIFFDDVSSRPSLMQPILKAFVELKGNNDLVKAIQRFMLASVASYNDGNGVGLDDVRAAVKETVHFLARLSSPVFRVSGLDEESDEANSFLDELRHMVALYCIEFMSLPMGFRHQLGPGVIGEVLLCMAALVQVKEGSRLMEFRSQVFEKFQEIALQSLEASPETIVEVAALMRALTKPKRHREARVDTSGEGNNGTDEDDEEVSDGDNASNSPSRHEHTMEAVNSIYGWLVQSSCPLPGAVRWRLLAASINSPSRRYIYPLVIEALPIFVDAIETSRLQGDGTALASSILLVAEIVFMSTLSLAKDEISKRDQSLLGLDASNESLGAYQLSKPTIPIDTLIRLTRMAASMCCDTTQSNIDVDLSVLYLLGALTRIPETHEHLKLEELVVCLGHRSTECLTSRDKRYRSMATLSTLILRHLIETPAYVEIMMQTEVLAAFPTSTNSRNKIKSFVSTGNMEFAFCRDFAAFRATVAKHYGLVWGYPPHRDINWTHCDLTARKNISLDQGKEAVIPQGPSLVNLQDETLSPRANKVISVLMEQLLKKTTDFPPQESPEANEQAESDDRLVFAHFERCAILVNIVELIHAYPVCREAFLKSPRINTFLAFLLERMTPSGELAGTLGSRLFVNESMWVSQLLDEICVGPLQVSSAERIAQLPERVNLVVDALDAALKQFISSSSGTIETYAKMSRAWCLIMTIYVLLSIKSTSSASTGLGRLLSPVQSAVTARMLEKGIMAALSTILRSIDRSAPMAPIVAAKIIFSMEILARLGNKLARLTLGGPTSGSAAELAALVTGELGSMSEDFDEAEMGMDMMEMDEDGESEDEDEDEDEMEDVDADEMDEDEFGDESEDDSETEMDMEMELVGSSDDQMLSGYSTGSEGAMTEDTTDVDEGEDMLGMDSEDDSDVEGEGVVRLVVQPPMGSGPASDAVASGFQVIPFDGSTAGMGAVSGGVGSFASAAFLGGGGGSHHHHMDEEFITEEDESMDEEAFSVDDEGDEDEEDDEGEHDEVDEDNHGFGHMGGSETIFDDGLVMSLQPRLGTIRRRFVGGLGDGFPLGGRASYSSQLRADANIDIFAHPLVAPRTLQGGALGPRTYGFETSRLPGPSAAAATSTGSGKDYMENQDVFHSPHIITTIRRWSQECRLFIGDDVGTLAKESAEAILLEPGTCLLEEARERHGRALAEYETQVERESEEAKKKRQAQEEEGEEVKKRQAEKATTLIEAESPTPPLAANEPPALSEQLQRQADVAPPPPPPPSASTNTPSEGPVYYEDMGPDREFLEALPFEMRREVLEQYFEERRRNIPDGAQVRINADFLASLSADLRADYERLSAVEVERFRRRAGHRLIGQMDIAALLQNMGPDVQRALLEAVETDLVDDTMTRRAAMGSRSTASASANEQVAGLINALSESMRRLRESGEGASIGPGNGGGRPTTLVSLPRDSTASPSVALPKRDYANMIDTASLATILRVFYDPLMTEHRTHMKLFLHLCAGPSTRADLLNMLVFILEESPEDTFRLDAVLETFLARKGTAPATSLVGTSGRTTPKLTPKKLKSSTASSKSTPSSTPDPFGGATHVVIQQRSMQLLMQLVQHNDDARKFFITPYDAPWTIKRHDKRANKTMVVSTKFPIVLLLACLERTNFAQIPLLVENLLHLLQLVSAPLKDSPEGPSLELPTPFITSMVKSVVSSELGPKAFQYATQVFQHFALLEPVANVIVSELADMSVRLVLNTIAEVRSLIKVVNNRDKVSVNETLKELGAASSSQCKLLRSMKILSSTILKPLRAEEDRVKHQGFDALITTPPIKWEPVKEAANKSAWAELFTAIDDCLRSLGEDSELFHVATGLLPAIEAQFWHLRQSFVLEASMRTVKEERLLNFAEVHRVLLNTMIRTNPNLLTTGAFILLTRMPRTLDFDNKRSWFRQHLIKRGVSRPSLSVHVRRAHVFEDSFHAIMGRSGDEVKYGRLSVKFHDEEGLDAGGVTREWFAVLSRQMFDPNYALFKISAVDKITYQPNRMSYINPDHLQYFAFVGRIIGKAIYDNRLLDCYFTRSFYKHILGIPVDFKDLEAVDPEFYKSLIWILENDITDVMEMTFSLEVDEFGSHKIIDLIPDGRSIPVTESNKKEYVRLVTECKLTTAIKPQIDAFLRGFHEVIPESLIAIFNEQELELLISGMPDIDVDDWRNNT